MNIDAANEGWWVFAKLKFLMPDEWRFVFRANDFRLVDGASAKNQARNVKIEQVIITPEGGETKKYPDPASAATFLCVKFRHD